MPSADDASDSASADHAGALATPQDAAERAGHYAGRPKSQATISAYAAGWHDFPGVLRAPRGGAASGQRRDRGRVPGRPGRRRLQCRDRPPAAWWFRPTRWPICPPALVGESPAWSKSGRQTSSEACYRIERDAFYDFVQKGGGVRSFGYPVSREFTLFGCQTQLFQRLAMQQCDGSGVGTLNVLEDGLLPYSRFNSSTVPASDPALIAAAPLPSDPNYGTRAIDFVRAHAPETVDAEPVKFFSTFERTVGLSDAFPQGRGDAGLLPLLNLQLWGLPTSQPAYDPNNHDLIYLRFQRGVMHYDKGRHCTQGLLLTDYLKDLLTGDHLPNDLAAQAADSPLLRAVPSGRALRAPSFGDAFSVQAPVAQPVAALIAPVAVSSPDYGMSAFLWGHPVGRTLPVAT